MNANLIETNIRDLEGLLKWGTLPDDVRGAVAESVRLLTTARAEAVESKTEAVKLCVAEWEDGSTTLYVVHPVHGCDAELCRQPTFEEVKLAYGELSHASRAIAERIRALSTGGRHGPR